MHAIITWKINVGPNELTPEVNFQHDVMNAEIMWKINLGPNEFKNVQNKKRRFPHVLKSEASKTTIVTHRPWKQYPNPSHNKGAI